MIDFNARYSRSILLRLLVLIIAAGMGAVAGIDFLRQIYLENQSTDTGYIINGIIVVLFMLGLLKMVAMLFRYGREERALATFAHELETGRNSPSVDVDEETLIFNRYRLVASFARQNAPVDHNALASMLVANESTRISFPKFIHNILILSGVFGTIVSLSIALLGASSLLDNASDTSHMGLVIHGMSTALSTTMTAIVCYVIYGYFYMKLTDAQTHLLSGIEQVTSVFLLPKYNTSNETLLHELTSLVRGLRQASDTLLQTQQGQQQAGEQLAQVVNGLAPALEQLRGDLSGVNETLRRGFRLSDEREA